MIVFADASPLVHLPKLGLLRLLEALFGEVRVTDRVLEEVLGHGDRPGAVEVAGASYLRREHADTDAAAAEELRERESLGLGEAWTLAAAVRLSAGLVILDDRRARGVACRLGLACIGTLRVLEMAFEAGMISDLRAVYVDVVRQRIRIAPALLDRSLERYGLPSLGQGTPPSG